MAGNAFASQAQVNGTPNLSLEGAKGDMVSGSDGSSSPSADMEMSPDKVASLMKALPEELKELAKGWQMVINKTPISIRGSLKMATPYVSEDGALVLMFEDNFAYSMICREMHLSQIKNIIVSIINKDVTLRPMYRDNAKEVKDSLLSISSIINAEITYEN